MYIDIKKKLFYLPLKYINQDPKVKYLQIIVIKF